MGYVKGSSTKTLRILSHLEATCFTEGSLVQGLGFRSVQGHKTRALRAYPEHCGTVGLMGFWCTRAYCAAHYSLGCYDC